MSYTINQTNGQLLINLLDGTADGPDINPGLNVSDINLFGKNYPNYGQYQNENFIKLLQNFSGATPPSNPLSGELWFDTSSGFLKIYNGSTFKAVAPITVAATQPSNSSVGDQWWDTSNDQFKTYNGSTWITVGPAYSKQVGISGAIPAQLVDTLGQTHTVIQFYTAGNLVSIASYDPTFTPVPSISGFSQIAPGVTLNSLTAATFIGTASNALTLGNLQPTQFARSDISTVFAANVAMAGGQLAITAAGTAAITNTAANGNINLAVNANGTTVTALQINGTNGAVTVAANPSTALGIATKQYVDSAVLGGVTGFAPIASPSFTGVPVAPTPVTTDVSNKIATTAFTQSAITAALMTQATSIANLYATISYVNNLALTLAPLASPQLTGTPTAPTQASSDASTKLATTAFTQSAIAASTQALWQGSAKFVSNIAPSNAIGNDGDFWFQI